MAGEQICTQTVHVSFIRRRCAMFCRKYMSIFVNEEKNYCKRVVVEAPHNGEIAADVIPRVDFDLDSRVGGRVKIDTCHTSGGCRISTTKFEVISHAAVQVTVETTAS